MKNYLLIFLIASTLTMTMAGCLTRPANPSPADPSYGIVKPTGRNIHDPKPDDGILVFGYPDKGLVGLTPEQVITKIGHPKTVSFATTDSSNIKLWNWEYTCEFTVEWHNLNNPEHPYIKGVSDSSILDVRFSRGKVKYAYWLPHT